MFLSTTKIVTCVCYLYFSSKIRVLLVFATCVLVPKLRCCLCLCFSYLYKYLCLCACVLPREVANLAPCTCTSTCVLGTYGISGTHMPSFNLVRVFWAGWLVGRFSSSVYCISSVLSRRKLCQFVGLYTEKKQCQFSMMVNLKF